MTQQKNKLRGCPFSSLIMKYVFNQLTAGRGIHIRGFLTSRIQEESVHFTFIFSSQFDLIGLVRLGQVNPVNPTDDGTWVWATQQPIGANHNKPKIMLIIIMLFASAECPFPDSCRAGCCRPTDGLSSRGAWNRSFACWISASLLQVSRSRNLPLGIKCSEV